MGQGKIQQFQVDDSISGGGGGSPIGNISSLRDSGGNERTFADTGGVLSLRSTGNTDTENRILRFSNQAFTNRAQVGFQGSDVLRVENLIHGGNTQISSEDSGGFTREFMNGDPDGLLQFSSLGDINFDVFANETALTLAANGPVTLFNDNTATARTATIPNGSMEVNTGGSPVWARVLTTNDAVPTTSSGSFTPAHIGFSVAPVGDITWQRQGNIVHVQLGFTTGISNGFSWSITNIPAELVSNKSQIHNIGAGVNNGVSIQSLNISTNQVASWTFNNNNNIGSNIWSNIGAKGMLTLDQSFSYVLDGAP